MSREPRLAGRVCLISGASRGFGQAIAVRFVEEGGRVALLSRSSCDETLGLISKIEGIADVASVAAWIPCDIGTEAECNTAVAACVAKFGDKIHGVSGGKCPSIWPFEGPCVAGTSSFAVPAIVAVANCPFVLTLGTTP